jgi:methylmalonyl-CoA mutase N-terminal domain/subunit
MNFFMEVAKLRAARRMWATIVKEQFAAQDKRSMMLRFHSQTGGVTLTAQQPLNNIIRVAYQALAAVLGGTQSLHTNGYDEALALPTEQAATLALRTQQILAEETGVPLTADPLGGSYYVEYLTDAVEAKAREWMNQVNEYGGAVAAIERGFVQDAIAESAYQKELARERGAEVVVGVNRYVTDESEVTVPIQKIDQEAVSRQMARVSAYKERQDTQAVESALDAVRGAAESTDNLLPIMKHALTTGATLGQICHTLRGVFGEYRPR